MLVNGERIVLEGIISLKAFLENEGFIIERVAVELNGKIVPRSGFETVFLEEKDKLEIVAFVGGG